MGELDQLYITSDPFNSKPGRIGSRSVGIKIERTMTKARSSTPSASDSDASLPKGVSNGPTNQVIKWFDGNPANFDYRADDIEAGSTCPPMHRRISSSGLQFDTTMTVAAA